MRTDEWDEDDDLEYDPGEGLFDKPDAEEEHEDAWLDELAETYDYEEEEEEHPLRSREDRKRRKWRLGD